MRIEETLLLILIILVSGSAAALPTVESTKPIDGSTSENKVEFQFNPKCDSECKRANFNFNTTGNLTFEWKIDKWESGENSGLEDPGEKLTLSSPGEFGKLNYEWYNTTDYYDSNGHPTSKSGLDEFFDDSNNGVSFGGEGKFDRRIHWHDSQWDEKPSYLPKEDYSWKVSGYLYVPESGTYSISIDSDDSADIIIDNTKVVSWYGGHGTENGYSHNGDITLDKGQHKIEIRMEEGYGNDGISVAWQKPGETSFSIIPRTRFADDSIKYDSSGSYETDTKRLNHPAVWTNVSKIADVPENTSVDLDFAVKKYGELKYYDNISDLPKTKNLKMNVSMKTEEDYTTPEINSVTLEYKTSANTDFHLVDETQAELKQGTNENTTIKGDEIRLSRTSKGPQGGLRYSWYNTSGLNSRNEYADDEEEMDKFIDPSVEGVSLGGKGLYTGEIHWADGKWGARPSYLPGEDYSWMAKGYVYTPTSGTYTIGIDSDDASDIFIDGNKVASFYGPHGTSGDYSHNEDITLSQGYHTIKVRMQEHTGGDGVSVGWKKPGDSSFSIIPAERLYPKVYQSSGNYTSDVFNALNQVEWKSSDISASRPLGTNYDIDYGTNKTGDWIYKDSIDGLPNSQFMKYRASLETTDGQKTPKIKKVNLTYANTETFFRTMKTIDDVQSGTENNLTYDFSSYSLPSTFEWNIEVEQDDGTTNTSEDKVVTIEERSFPKPDIEWYEPDEGDRNRTPINYTFKPTCYSEYGCYEAAVHFNSSGKKGSWVYESEADWSLNGTEENLTYDSGNLQLEGTVGNQGELNYYWYNTTGLNQNNGYAESEQDMDKFFDTDFSGVNLGGQGTHSENIDWATGTYGPKPSYLPKSQYSWKAQGYIYAPTSGTYTIGIDSDDGSDVLINGEKIASYYGGHGTSGSYSNQGKVSLEEGYHNIKVRMQENTGRDGISLGWEKPEDSSLSTVPANRLYKKDTKGYGNYTSNLRSTGKKVSLIDAQVNKEAFSSTDIDIDYLENSSGTWNSHDSVSDVPEAKHFLIEIEMSSSSENTPEIRKINLSYEDKEVFKKRFSKKEVYNQSSDRISLNFLNFSLPKVFRTVLSVKQSNGETTRTSPRTIKVKFSGIKSTISWNDIADNEIGYKVSTNASGSWKQVGSTDRDVQQFQDRNPNLKDGDYACYRVKAYNTVGESSPLQGCKTFTEE